MKTHLTIGLGAALLLGLGFAAVFWFDGEYAPISFVVVLPMSYTWTSLGKHGAWIGTAVAPISFLPIARHIQRSRAALPMISCVTFAVVVTGSILWAGWGWKPTIGYTLKGRAIALVVQSLVPPVALAGYVWNRRRHLEMPESLLLHWIALAWFVWSAFPWYGELL